VSKWRCNFNKKSQVVVHGRKPKEESSFYIDKKQLQTVTAYKYLGIEIQRNLNWKQWYKIRILGKAKNITIMIKAMFLKNNKHRSYGRFLWAHCRNSPNGSIYW